MTDRLLTAREVADWFGCSPETILRWSRAGKLPAIPLPSGAIRFRESEIEAQLESWATTERGSASHPAGRRPPGNLATASHPNNEEE